MFISHEYMKWHRARERRAQAKQWTAVVIVLAIMLTACALGWWFK